MKYTRKFLSLFLLLSFVVQGSLGFTAPAEALFGVSIPSPSKVASDLEKRYNLDLESLQSQAQLANGAEDAQLAPQVSITFDPTDPRPGQQLTAIALPLYFNGPQEQLYYTWYLRRAGCDLERNPSASTRALCDEDGDNSITVEDWKIAAMGEIVRDGFNNENVNYSTDTDNDGYRARFGGSSRVGVPNHCYYNDPATGQDYEISDASSTDFTCPDGKDPVCVVADQVIEPGEITENFEVSEGTACFISAAPTCSRSGAVSCSVGSPRCIDRDIQDDCGETLSVCSTTSEAGAGPQCRHLFPSAPDAETGDGTFGASEEQFWRTDTNDDSTADNGNKDEANVAGLGRMNFTWNYGAGDSVGVVVEGTTLFPTKHADSSFQIMWGFSKNDCPMSEAEGTGSYTKTVKNYQVTIPTVDIDLNDCLERNLVDPTEGGQPSKLDLQMVSSPENPVNDETEDRGGDTLVVQTIVNNGQKGAAGQFFDWRVEIANNPQFNNAVGRVADITESLLNAGLLRQSEGMGLDTLEINLNMDRSLQLAGRSLSEYLAGEQGYLRISSRVSENFASGIVRSANTNTIVAFTSTRNKIIAYKASPVLVEEKMRVKLPDSEGIICQDSRLDRAICRVTEREIIGLKIDAAGLSNFQWSINDTPLQCSSSTVSQDCTESTQNEVNFFPVSGGVGSSYTVSVTANDLESGKTVSLSRLFQVVEPTIAVVSNDPAVVFPKFLGQYRDIRGSTGGCPEGICNSYSKTIFQGYNASLWKLKAIFIPSFLGRNSQVEWTVNGKVVSTATTNEISIDAENATPGNVENITVRAVASQDDNTRRALVDTWGISQLDSGEQRFEQSVQIETLDNQETGIAAGARKYFAALGTYLPETFLYTLRMLLSGGLVLFVAGVAFVLIPGENITSRKIRYEDSE